MQPSVAAYNWLESQITAGSADCWSTTNAPAFLAALDAGQKLELELGTAELLKGSRIAFNIIE